ncbi:MAG: S1 family peptidase [Planctomycetota bacterium]
MALITALIVLVNASSLTATQWPWSKPVAPPRQPDPAVARVCIEESDGIAYGSGTLVDVRDRFGLVVTNWHVVQGDSGAITVLFPGGFRSPARVLDTDRDWDLAALLIWRPPVAPIPLASSPPRPGDQLTIAGYGSGTYQRSRGRCTQYVAPSAHHPFEMVEVSASARQGDSGGPIFNAAGELAGVLFGSNGGTTSGAYAGRIHEFLSTVWPPPDESKPAQTLVASAPDATPRSALQRLPATTDDRSDEVSSTAPMKSLPQNERRSQLASGNASPRSEPAPPKPSGEVDTARTAPTALTWQDIAGDSLFQQCKTFLAILGFVSLLAFLANLFAPTETRSREENGGKR